MAGEHQKLNASLALQLCRRWLIEKDQWADKNARAQGVSRFTEGLPISFKDGLYIFHLNTYHIKVTCRH